ncbi:hypothetical protein DJ021_10425 [Phenylobacterium hankyongense]|uniref:Uncharacterized protein n=2 Tax=Phenylobacterium hankyongense TaxID=1813876 RepID=A0A328B2P0_9CAUL|nr:hypothetical protein DJ021_10425 [Phenylobacterium hankyongense]
METEAAKDGFVLVAVIGRDENRAMDVNFAGDYEAQSNALQDQLGGAKFYWYAEPEHLLALSGYAIEASLSHKTKVTPVD